MESVSPGVLQDCRALLRLAEETQGLMVGSEEMFAPRFEVASPKRVFSLTLECGWLTVDPYGRLTLTSSGQDILAEEQYQYQIRLQLVDVVVVTGPIWAPVLSRGRREARKHLPPEVNQCFEEADLYQPITPDQVRWWDRIAGSSREIRTSQLLETGRRGEELTLRFELDRTGVKPTWESIESDYSGFDVLSVVSDTDSSRLRIEVKATRGTAKGASFYCSRHQCDVAARTENYMFYLWAFAPLARLWVVPYAEVCEHIPTDSGSGSWNSCIIPYGSLISGKKPAFEAKQ